MLIGLSGFAKSGKTTAAVYIETKYGIPRRHIAEPLRDMLRPLLIANGVPIDMIDRYLTGDLKEEVIPEIGCTSRHLQITLGTEWGRVCITPRLWSRTWRRMWAGHGNAMNDSVRFVDEQEEIKGAGGFTILIKRPGTEPIAWRWGWIGKLLYRATGKLWGAHDSERPDRLTPTVIINNNGSRGHLYRQIDFAMAMHGVRPVEGVTLVELTA